MDQLVHSHLAMVFLHFRQDQPGRVAIVEPAKIRLVLEQLVGLFQGQRSIMVETGRFDYSSNLPLSFLATAIFFRRT